MLLRLRPRHAPYAALGLTVALSDLLCRLPLPAWRGARPVELLDWGQGVSVVIPERGAPEMLAQCLDRLGAAMAHTTEPSETIVVVNGSAPDAYAELARAHPAVRWVHHRDPLGFTSAVLRGVAQARYGSVYLLNNDMLLEPEALRAVLSWRGPHVFAVASQIFFQDSGRRREETGWTSMTVDDGLPRPWHEEPLGPTVRGTVYAGAGSALFHTGLLRKLLPDSLPFDPFYWEDTDLGVRAWRLGYEALFCPASVAWHKHRATVERFYEAAEVARIFERNRIQFQLRNPFPRQGLRTTLHHVASLDRATLRELGSWKACRGLWGARWRAACAPYRDLGYEVMWTKRYLRPPGGPRRPKVVLVAPYAVLPPAHGSAVRIQRLATQLAKEFDVILLSDEADLYRGPAEPADGPFSSVHLVSGRPGEPEGLQASRIARIRSHSHRALRTELSRIMAVHRPVAVLVQHMELGGLVDVEHRPAFILDMHDVLLCPGDTREAEADRYETELMDRFDGLIVSSPEDQALLGGRRSRLVPNGADLHPERGYTPSAGNHDILFMGPFRADANWVGIRDFLERAYPAVEAAVPGVSVTILGGKGAPAMAASEPCFARPSIRVLEFVDDLRPLLAASAVTINPQAELRGSSLKLIESAGAGRVCVSTRAGARGWLDQHLRSIVTVERVSDFAGPLIRLLSDETYRLALEAPDPEKLASRSWEAAGNELRAYVREVVARVESRRLVGG
jgi:GT2 family glycosyltransferase